MWPRDCTSMVRNLPDVFSMETLPGLFEEPDLRSNPRPYQMVLDAMPHMVWTADSQCRLKYANSRWIEYTGLSLEVAACLGWEPVLHPADRERTWTAWHRATQAGTVFEVEHRLRRAKDGGYRWHLARAVPLRDEEEGEITGWLGTSTEIEEQKQAGQADLEKQKFDSIGRLAGGIAHDFNNLLAGILGSASIAMQSLPPAHPARDMLRSVVEAGERGAELTSRMLAYAGKASFCAERLRLDALARETCATLRGDIPDAIQLEFTGAADPPPVETNERLTRQLVTELVRNAVEAIGPAGGKVSVSVSALNVGMHRAHAPQSIALEELAGRYAVLEVRDTGCGMDEETQKNMFDPFFSTKFPGRGLGLAAVYGFVRTYGGKIQVESAPGEGASVRVLLPAAGSRELANRAGSEGLASCNRNS